MKSNVQVPPGLTLCQKELGSIAGQFVRLVNYNKQVSSQQLLYSNEEK
jgi:hypothetical protein